LTRLRQRVTLFEEQVAQRQAARVAAVELRQAVGRLKAFAAQVRTGLDTTNHALQRAIILALVRRVEVDDPHVRVVFKVSATPRAIGDNAWRHCSHGARHLAQVGGLPPVRRPPTDRRGGMTRPSILARAAWVPRAARARNSRESRETANV